MPKKPEQELADHEKLRALFDAREPRLSQTMFGKTYEIGTQGMVWQYLSGGTPLNHVAAAKFAKGLDVPVSAFSETLARKPEKKVKVRRVYVKYPLNIYLRNAMSRILVERNAGEVRTSKSQLYEEAISEFVARHCAKT